MVPKKTPDDWGLCGDYGALNNVTIPDRYHISHIHDFSAILHGSTIISNIDLVKAYYQIPVHPDDTLSLELQLLLHNFQCYVCI